MAKHKVRTTINPGEVLTVDDAELLDLERQGLLLPTKQAEQIEKAEANADAESGALVARTEARAPHRSDPENRDDLRLRRGHT